jgi:hypothetical protein
MNPEPKGMSAADGMRPDSGAANIAVVRRLFEAVETRRDPKDFATPWAAYIAMYDPDVGSTRPQPPLRRRLFGR